MLNGKVLVVFIAGLIGTLGYPHTARAAAVGLQATTRGQRHAITSIQMKEIEEALREQTRAIRALQVQVQSRDRVIDQLQKRVDTLQDTFTATQQKLDFNATQGNQAATTLQNEVADLKTVTASTANAFQESQKQIADFEHPTQLRFKGITLTPGGFLEAAGIFAHTTRTAMSAVPMATSRFRGPPMRVSLNSGGQPGNPGFRSSPRAKWDPRS
ncbi:MAG: hypothetical protein WA628_17735 [Terriglobales bacterium]